MKRGIAETYVVYATTLLCTAECIEKGIDMNINLINQCDQKTLS